MENAVPKVILLPGEVEKRAICIGILATTGKPIKVVGNEPSDFITTIRDCSVAWINFVVEDVKKDAEAIASSFGFSSYLVTTLLANRHSGYEDLDIELGLLVPAITVKKFDVVVHPLLILMRKSIVLTIHSKDVVRLVRFARYGETFMRKISPHLSWQDKVTLMLHRLLDENNTRNFDNLREIEEQGDDLSRVLADPHTPRVALASEIYKMKHALITYLNMLWATLDVLSSLRYGDAEIITDSPKLLTRFEILIEDVNRQISLAEHMSEVLASGLEVLQSIYNNQLQILNNRMAKITAWMTVLGTALLVPNTIATIMSNSAFQMTWQDVWWYAPLLFGTTSISTYIAYYVVRRKGLVPTTIE